MGTVPLSVYLVRNEGAAHHRLYPTKLKNNECREAMAKVADKTIEEKLDKFRTVRCMRLLCVTQSQRSESCGSMLRGSLLSLTLSLACAPIIQLLLTHVHCARFPCSFSVCDRCAKSSLP